jgi:hypothetical protein
VGRPPWREDGSVTYSCNSLPLSGSSPAELMITSYCLIFTPRRNIVAQLYPQALGSLSVASYNWQGYGGSILTRLHTGSSDQPCAYVYISPIVARQRLGKSSTAATNTHTTREYCWTLLYSFCIFPFQRLLVQGIFGLYIIIWYGTFLFYLYLCHIIYLRWMWYPYNFRNLKLFSIIWLTLFWAFKETFWTN